MSSLKRFLFIEPHKSNGNTNLKGNRRAYIELALAVVSPYTCLQYQSLVQKSCAMITNTNLKIPLSLQPKVVEL